MWCDTIHFSNNGLPIIKIAELKNGITPQTNYTEQSFSATVKLHYDDLLFAWSGNPDTSIDIFRYRLENGWLNQHIFKVEPFINKDYFYYLMKSLKPTFVHIASNKQTTGLGHVTISDLKRLEVCLHNEAEQQHIVDILGSIDDKIEYLDNFIKKLEYDGELLFKSVFENKDVEKKMIELSSIATFSNGYSYSGEELCELSDVGLVTIKNFERNGGFKLDGFKPLKVLGKIKPSMYAKKGELLVAHTDLTQNADIIGNPILLLNLSTFDKAIISMDLVKVESNIIAKELMYFILKSSNFKAHALGYCSGTTVLHLSKKALQEYVFDMPNDKKIIADLTNKLKVIFERISVSIEEVKKLKALKDLYLQKFFG